ncbi:MAG: hypothetical protein R2778_16195 [Saprospiraceae bacterium]
MKKKISFFRNRKFKLFTAPQADKSEQLVPALHDKVLHLIAEELDTQADSVRHFQNAACHLIHQAVAHGNAGIPEADSASSHAEETLNNKRHEAKQAIRHHASVARKPIARELHEQEALLASADEIKSHWQHVAHIKGISFEHNDHEKHHGLKVHKKHNHGFHTIGVSLHETLNHLKAVYDVNVIHATIQHYKAYLSHLDKHEQHCLDDVENIYESAVTQYCQFNQKARHHNNLPLVKRWKALDHAA